MDVDSLCSPFIMKKRGGPALRSPSSPVEVSSVNTRENVLILPSPKKDLINPSTKKLPTCLTSISRGRLQIQLTPWMPDIAATSLASLIIHVIQTLSFEPSSPTCRMQRQVGSHFLLTLISRCSTS